MSVVEHNHLLPNFSLEKGPVDVDLLKAKGYDGFGAIGVIINENNQILMVKESRSKDGDNKIDQWGPVYETGNLHDSSLEITMIAGLASELGLNILGHLTKSREHIYGYDFRRKPSEAPSRSLISVYYLSSQDLPPQNEWGSEISDVRWMTIDEIIELPNNKLRVNAKAILQELSLRTALIYNDGDTAILDITPSITPEFLVSRTPETDVHWTK
jgi:hypothetical protein